MTRSFSYLLVAIAFLIPASSLMASDPGTRVDVQKLEAAPSKLTEKWVRLPDEQEPTDDGVHRYIVQFEGKPLPLYDGGIAGLAPASVVQGRLDPNSASARAYVAHLQRDQSAMIADMSAKAGVIQIERTHQHALNGVTVRMTKAQADKVRGLPGVRLVERDRALELETATTPTLIGATQVWDGSATGVPYQGEGMVVGIIDSGINHEHPSFAAVGGDGYVHVNPLGSGVFLGECTTIAGLCNDKLIGAYTFLDSQQSPVPDEILLPGDAPSTDTDGHGSHVASTAAGNILPNIALPDADGNPSSVVFPQISGVAPHANVVAFKVCAPSCFFADIVAAVDQAIADGVVDAINHSIGSPGGNPWNSSQAQAFLSARAAGIFVSNSAGNSGPDAGTAEAAGNAPWVAGVAATTHSRAFPTKMLMNMAGGDTTPPADIVGRSLSGAITGDIVYAGDFPTANGSQNDTQPEQCLDPFPAGWFTANQIVLCDRGAIARVAKGQNVRDGGAGGFILGNVDAGATSVNDDPHVIPAIHIDATDANAVRAWLASGTGHTGTITAVDTVLDDPSVADNLAGFSSRGPYTGFDILAPNTAAPGVSVLAAGAELTQGQIDLIHLLYPPNLWESVPGEFGQISGTSMASPHITGTAALIKQARPGWTDAEVLSAIQTTGTYDLVKEDGVTPADPHDFGGGRVQVAQAINAALVLDESAASFQAANPDTGGDPAALNVAGLVQDRCVLTCAWTRTVTATTAGDWTASGFDSWVSVSPASFSLAAGESQVIEITADASALPADTWSFNRAVLTPSDGSLPTTQMPVAVVPATGELPASMDIFTGRDAGSQLFPDNTAVTTDSINVRVFEPAMVQGMSFALPEDSDNGSPFDDLSDGVEVVIHDVPGGTQRALFEVLSSDSPDLDLFVGLVLDPSNPVDPGLLVCTSATATALESCDLDPDFLDLLRSIFGPDLQFYAVIQNWAASAPGAVDAFEFAATNVSGVDAVSMSVEGPAGVVQPLEPFDVRVFFDVPSSAGDRYISTTEWYGDAAQTALLGKVPLQLTRGVDDVVVSTDPGPLDVDTPFMVNAVVQPNFTLEDRTYDVAVYVPWGIDVDPASITDGGVMEHRWIRWNVTQDSLVGAEGSYTVSTDADNPFCDTGFGGYIDLAAFGILPDPTFTGDTIFGTFFSGQNPIDFYGTPRDTGLTVSDDGFGFFNSTPGPAPWVNQLIPDVTDPNDLLAPMWSDWVINYNGDSTAGRIRGLSAATAGPNVSVIEWDGMEIYPGDGGTPIAADFELVVFSTVDPDLPEIVFAYDNVDETWVDTVQGAGLITSGVENSTGTAATPFAGAFTDDLIVCYDYQGPDTSPRTLSFTATAHPILHGREVWLRQRNSVDNPGSEAVGGFVPVEFNQLPYEFDWLRPAEGESIRIKRNKKVRIEFRVWDPVIWWRALWRVDARVEITDSSGTVVDSGNARFRFFGWRYQYKWRLNRNLTPGDYTITVYLDDGTRHTRSVELR